VPQEPQHQMPQSGEDVVLAPPPFRRRFADGLSGPLSGQRTAFLVVALGGALGAVARYLLGLALPTRTGEFPLGTFLINAIGGLLIGILLVLLTETFRAHPLLRPFLVTGILGGFTTFSTYCVDIEKLIAAHAFGTAMAYLFGTLAAALGATALGVGLARAASSRFVRPAGTADAAGTADDTADTADDTTDGREVAE
jgi:fluoride exporter